MWLFDENSSGPWTPQVDTSSDGGPLAKTIPELFWAFPYDRLPVSNRFISNFLRPEVVVIMIAFYVTSKGPLKEFCAFFGITGKTEAFRLMVALHNAALQTFSLVVAVNTWPIVWKHYEEYGFMDAYCDRGDNFWRSGFGAWATIFYLSKYYEFLDTWVLVMKGKEPSFLQVYHHTGIAFTMWGGIVSHSSWLQSVVLLNSVIHTVMYSYFFCKTMFPRLQMSWAKYLTQAQIAQFLLGIIYTIPVQFMGSSCDTASSRFVLALIHVYAIGLVLLFLQFAKRKYKRG